MQSKTKNYACFQDLLPQDCQDRRKPHVESLKSYSSSVSALSSSSESENDRFARFQFYCRLDQVIQDL